MKRRIKITENELRNLISERVTKALSKRHLIKESMRNGVEEQYYNFLLDSGIVGEEALGLAVDLEGYSVDTFDSVLYAMTGYRALDQMKDEFDFAEYFDEDALEYFGLIDEVEDDEEDFDDEETF